MLVPVYTKKFNHDVRRVSQRGYDMEKLKDVIKLLLTGVRPLPAKYKDHQLGGEWSQHRDLHIAFDWILIYTIKNNQCIFSRTGTHSDLFSL